MTGSPPADRMAPGVRAQPCTQNAAPPARLRDVRRLMACALLCVAAWPPDELREPALLPLFSWPELPCWLAPVRELPCCWLLLIPEPDWLPESCACASWTRPAAGSAETGPATATAAAAPKMTASIRIFFSWRGSSPQRQSGRGRSVSAAGKNSRSTDVFTVYRYGKCAVEACFKKKNMLCIRPLA